MQQRAIACRGPDDHCHLLFRISQQTPGRRWKESVVFCCLCLSSLQLGIIRRIRTIRIIMIINIIGIIEIISKILPEHQAAVQALPRHQRPPTSLYRARHYCPQLIPRYHTSIRGGHRRRGTVTDGFTGKCAGQWGRHSGATGLPSASSGGL